MENKQPVDNALAIGANMRMALSGLSSTEKKVGEWLLNKSQMTIGTSLKSVAQELAVSEALVVKVAKKLGYSGFRELREALASYHAYRPAEQDLEITPDDSTASAIDKVFNSAIHSLKEAQSVIDPSVIERAAQAIMSAQKVVLFAVGGSASVCHDFQHKLLRVGYHALVYSDHHLMMMAACQLAPNDLAIIISQSGDTTNIIQVAEEVQSRSAHIISITNDSLSPLAQLADYSIYSPAKRGAILGQNAVARIVQLNLLDVLFVELFLQDYAGTTEKLKRSADVVRPLRG